MDIRTNSWVFQNSVTTTGNGETFTVGRNNQLIIFITGTSTSRTIYFEGSDAESTPNWYSIPAVKLPELTVASSTTGNNEVYAIDLAPWYSVRCRISAVSGGTVKVVGRIVESGTSLINSSVTALSGSKTGDVILADAVTTIGAKTAITVGGAGALRANIYGTGAFSVKLQGVMYDGTSYTIPAEEIINGIDYTDIITAGIYEWDIAGFVAVNLYVTTVTTNVSCKGALLA